MSRSYFFCNCFTRDLEAMEIESVLYCILSFLLGWNVLETKERTILFRVGTVQLLRAARKAIVFDCFSIATPPLWELTYSIAFCPICMLEMVTQIGRSYYFWRSNYGTKNGCFIYSKD